MIFIDVKVIMTNLKLQNLGIESSDNETISPAMINIGYIEMITPNTEDKNQTCIYFKSGSSCIVIENYQSFVDRLKHD